MTRSLLLILTLALFAGCSGKKKPAPQGDPVTKKDKDAEDQRKKAKEQAIQDQKKSDEAVAAAEKATADKKYEEAIRHYQEAIRLHKTEALLGRLKEVEDKLERIRSAQRLEDYKLAMDAGRDAVKKNNHRGAMNSFKEALRLKQADEDATTQLALAQLALARQLQQEGAGHYDGKRYEQAVTVLTEANQLDPKSTEITALLKSARERRDANRTEIQKREDFSKLLSAAQTALTANKYPDAIKSYESALLLFPTDADALKQMENARKKQQDEYDRVIALAQDAIKKQRYQEAIDAFKLALLVLPGDKKAQTGLQTIEGARKRQEFDQFMAQGKAAKKPAEALKHFEAAVNLFPLDADALKFRDAAKKEVDELSRGDLKKKQEFDRLVGLAKAATNGKKYSDAVKHYEAALLLFPDDAVTRKGVADSRKAEKQQREDYKLAMDAGLAAIKKENYLGAVNSYKAALQIMPGTQSAQDALQIAQGRLKQAFDKLVAQGKTAAGAKQHAEALKHFEGALGLIPTDAEAMRLRDAAKKEIANIARLEAEAMKRDKNFASAVQAGKAALMGNKFQAAKDAFKTALALRPNDQTAQDGLQKAEAGLKTAGNSKKQEFDRLMTLAGSAMTAKKYADAGKHYEAALALVQTSAEARKGAADAKKAEKQQREDFKLAMDAGLAAIKKSDFLGAVNSYKGALQIKPGEQSAKDNLQIAEDRLNKEFTRLMMLGKTAAGSKKFPDAVKHYEAALKLKPNDSEAAAVLKRARDGKP